MTAPSPETHLAAELLFCGAHLAHVVARDDWRSAKRERAKAGRDLSMPVGRS